MVMPIIVTECVERVRSENKCERVSELMRDNDLHGEVWEEAEEVVAVEICWGDWKHEHARLDWLMRESLHPVSVVTETTEEDGSDCYSAIHRYYF